MRSRGMLGDDGVGFVDVDATANDAVAESPAPTGPRSRLVSRRRGRPTLGLRASKFTMAS